MRRFWPARFERSDVVARIRVGVGRVVLTHGLGRAVSPVNSGAGYHPLCGIADLWRLGDIESDDERLCVDARLGDSDLFCVDVLFSVAGCDFDLYSS